MNYLKRLTLLPQLRGVKTAVLLDGPAAGHRIIFAGGMILDAVPKDTPLVSMLPILQMIPQTCTMNMGGNRVFLEVLDSVPRLILCGAGHVAQAMIPMAKAIGFSVTVIDDREEFAQQAEDAGADPVYCMSFSEALGQISGGEDAYFAILTRASLFDQKCLEDILPKEWAYVGMLGSQMRGDMVRKRMLQKGFDAEKVAAVHAPIGLDISAQTPEEIAISVLAEVISVYRSGQRGGQYPARLLEKGGEGNCVLATIVAKSGSTPRAIGTKMLVGTEDILGTIGGGETEAAVIGQCRRMIADATDCLLKSYEIHLQDTGDTEFSSGTITVLMERMEPAEAKTNQLNR